MNTQAEKYIAPVQELNTLAIENIEKLVNMQVKRFEETAKLGVEQLKAAAAVKDVDGMKDFFTAYAEAVRALSEKTIEDVRTVFELGNAYSNEAQRICKDALKIN